MKHFFLDNPYFKVLYTYFIVILIGAVFLKLDISSYNLSYIDALFTSVSAVCVTGLSVIDIGKELTFFGQLVLLTLIQLGGLGIIVISSLIFVTVRKKISLVDQSAIEESLTVDKKINIKKIVFFVVKTSFIIELIGAVLLFFVFIKSYPVSASIYYAVFHSISAFCNAGFGIFPDSFEFYRGNVLLNLTLIFLIFFGGIGHFFMLELSKNFKKNKLNFKKYIFSLNTKISFKVSIALIFIGAISIFLFEYNNSSFNLSFSDKILSSFFQSVSSRTAGFSTISFAKVSSASLMIIMFLMLIGASSASCGGGIKTTTFYILIKYFVANIKNRQAVFMGNRTVPRYSIRKAIIIYISYIVVLFFSALLLCYFEQKASLSLGFNLKDLVFETFSALGTVGLSTGVTPYLSILGKLTLCLTMFLGRSGILTLVSFFAFSMKEERFQYPEEDIFVG